MSICPKCNTKHNKPGKFCSRACANSRGPRSEEFKEAVRKKLIGKTIPKEIVHRAIEGRRVNDPFYGSYHDVACMGCGKILHVRSKIQNTTCGASECIKAAHVISGKKSASRRVLRSKDETRLFELCQTVFSDAQSNTIVAGGWDADIVIPSKKIAILWNGPWHYREMGMKNHSLAQVKNRDRIKTELFKSIGWTVMVFEDRYYTPESAFKEVVGAEGVEPT